MNNQVNITRNRMGTGPRTALGFTLIELMITLAVLTILAAIAYPSYVESSRKTKRSDAKTAIMETAQVLERCFTQFNAYNHANCPVQNGTSGASSKGYYNIARTVNAASFTLVATPSAGGAQAGDAKCASFTLTETGAQTSKNGAGADANDCWD